MLAAEIKQTNLIADLKLKKAYPNFLGGGYEAQLGTPDYKVMWKKRSGFATIAIEV